MLTLGHPARPHTRSQTLRLAHGEPSGPLCTAQPCGISAPLPARISPPVRSAGLFSAPGHYSDTQLLRSVCDLLYCTLDNGQGDHPLNISSPRHLQPGRALGRFIAWPRGGNLYECPIYPDGGLSTLQYRADSQADALLLAIWLHPDCQALLPGSGWPAAPTSHCEFLARSAQALADIRALLTRHAATQVLQPFDEKPPVAERILQLLHAQEGVPSNKKMFAQLKAEGYREFRTMAKFSKAVPAYKTSLWKTGTRDNRAGQLDRILLEEQKIAPQGHETREWRAIIQNRQPLPNKAVTEYFASRKRSGHLRTDEARRVTLDLRGFRFSHAAHSAPAQASTP